MLPNGTGVSLVLFLLHIRVYVCSTVLQIEPEIPLLLYTEHQHIGTKLYTCWKLLGTF